MSWVQNNSHKHPQPPQQQQQSQPPAAAYYGKNINTVPTNSNTMNALNNPMNPALQINNHAGNPVSMSYNINNNNHNNGMGTIRHPQQQQQQQQPSYANNTQNNLNNHQQIAQQQPQQQQKHWQQQQSATAMQPMNNVVVPPTANNSWQKQQHIQQQQQQHQQQQHNQNVTNANVYQQHVPPPATPITNNWQTNVPATVGNAQQQQQQPQQQQPYGNYYAQQNAGVLQQQQQQQQQPAHHFGQHDAVNFFQQNVLATTTATSLPQQQQPPQQAQLLAQPSVPTNIDYFENNNNNNNINNSNTNSQSADGWSDWDWNDNNVVNSEMEPQQTEPSPQQSIKLQNPQPPPAAAPLQQQQPQQHAVYNSLEDSFSNDNWNWNVSEEQTALNSDTAKRDLPKSAASSSTSSSNFISTPSNAQQVPLMNVPHLVAHSKPTTLPLTETTNENYNDLKGDVVAPAAVASTAAVATTHNIPNSVYVSQAKPVARPTRQYASPPGGNTPTVELPDSALTPPQAFQNEAETASGLMQTQTPTVATQLPPATMLPPPVAVGTASASSNPFKRSGVAQHHRATGLLSATPAATTAAPLGAQQPNAAATIPTPMTMTSFSAPPPPADFANPMSVPLADTRNLPESGENLEDLHENQEVLAPPPPLPSVGMQPIIMPDSSAIASPPPPPPPNDERNQYMQTSQLSENPDEELNIESDNLPPPGLSRLVLGQPEFGATQRLVTGTEEPNALSLNMPIEERQADGEDTSDEQPVAQLPAAMPASDRNLYLVPGESNNTNVQQRVVTGVEMGVDVGVTTPPSNEQREIILDGENLNDQHQPQQQHHQQHPHQQVINTVVSRNEPPLEGAASGSDIQVPASVTTAVPVETQASIAQQQSGAKNTKEHSNMSTGNDDESDTEQHARYMLSKKSHKQTDLNKSERQRKDKQRSAERYESEDSMEYSSDREQEREHERDRRRGYREGSIRSEHGDERDYRDKKQRRNDKQALDSDERKQRDKYYYRGGDASRTERRSQRYHTRYDADSRYETEESISRHETSRKDPMRRSMRGGPANNQPADERSGGGRSDRSDRDYEEYRQRYQRSGNKRDKDLPERERERRSAGNYDDERREQRRTRQRNERDDFDTTLERQRRRHYRGGDARVDPREYDEYRKQSSRNARDSDLEKERLREPRDMRAYDPRHAAMYAYPSAGYGYDPYTAYYYEQMARTNPQAYAELYKKYYGHAPPAGAIGAVAHANAAGTAPANDPLNASAAATNAPATDGRESVHSGRSSAHNDKERYTHAYISHANDYHHQRHYQQHQQQQQQQYHLHHQYLYQMSATLNKNQFSNGNNQTMNSTMLDDTASGYGFSGGGSIYGGIGVARSTGNLSQIGSTSAAAAHSHAAYYAGLGEHSYYARSEYADSRSGHLSLRDADPALNEPQRLTPCKFNSEHALVSFSSGILVTFKPKYTSHGHMSNIVKLLRLNINDATKQLIQSFPGPLVRGLTHKKTIIEFCEEQIRLGPMQTTIFAKQLLPTNVEKYRASYTLMWNLLILLLRQNGMVVGTDIAELLLKNQQQFPYQPHTHQSPNLSATSTSRSTKSDSPDDDASAGGNSDIEVDAVELQNDDEAAAAHKHVASNELSAKLDGDSENPMPQQQQAQLSEIEITEKFRNYLLYGNVNEALDWATDNNLWGHALFLASKVDRRLHANVMMKFANKLALNDPLQTLYQLMSGRTPSSVTSIQDEKWGDWRPHLSMILSNTSQKPELDRKAITTLGDSLFNRGDLFAAHFCYLMAQVGFGRYQENAAAESSLQQNLPKLVLLGSSHYKSFHEFATTEAIIMTEIYEYACSLNDEKFSIVEFQPYKYLLAARLLDYGYHLRSLMYLEQTALHVQRDPSKYEATLIYKIFELADRLKYYDPVLEKSEDNAQNADGSLNTSGMPHLEEQKWLQDLRVLAAQHKFEYQGLPTSTPANAEAYNQTASDSYHVQSQIDQQFMEINKQFNELNLQYANNTENVAVPPTFYNPETMQQQTDQHTQQQPSLTDTSQQNASMSAYTQPLQQTNYGTEQSTAAEVQDHTQAAETDAYSIAQQQYAQSLDQQQQQQQLQQQQYQQNAYYVPNQQQQVPQQYGLETTDQVNNQSYDYWTQQQQQQYANDEQLVSPQNNLVDAYKQENDLISTNTPAAAVTNKYKKLELSNVRKPPTTAPQKITSPIRAKANNTASKQSMKSTLDKTKLANRKQNEMIGNKYASGSNSKATSKLYGNGGYGYERSKSNVTGTSTGSTTTTTTTAAIPSYLSSYSTPFLTNDNAGARPTITMPKRETYDSGDEAQKQTKQSQQSNAVQQQQGKKAQQQSGKNDAKDASKSSQQTNQNSGWFGGIWNKLSLKPKNQMILPDDKNPTIVWDPEKKRWVNTDGGDENGDDTLKPPPKMSDIMPQQTQAAAAQPMHSQFQTQTPQQQAYQPVHSDNSYMQQATQLQPQYAGMPATTATPAVPLNSSNTSSIPAATAATNVPTNAGMHVSNYSASAANAGTPSDSNATTKPPSLQSNMFKMQRNRTLKNSYVDVFNPSGKPASKEIENVLAPSVPPANVPQGGFFIPGAPVAAQNDNSAYQTQAQPQQDATAPQFYNPNQFAGGSAY